MGNIIIHIIAMYLLSDHSVSIVYISSTNCHGLTTVRTYMYTAYSYSYSHCITHTMCGTGYIYGMHVQCTCTYTYIVLQTHTHTHTHTEYPHVSVPSFCWPVQEWDMVQLVVWVGGTASHCPLLPLQLC